MFQLLLLVSPYVCFRVMESVAEVPNSTYTGGVRVQGCKQSQPSFTHCGTRSSSLRFSEDFCRTKLSRQAPVVWAVYTVSESVAMMFGAPLRTQLDLPRLLETLPLLHVRHQWCKCTILREPGAGSFRTRPKKSALWDKYLKSFLIFQYETTVAVPTANVKPARFSNLR